MPFQGSTTYEDGGVTTRTNPAPVGMSNDVLVALLQKRAKQIGEQERARSITTAPEPSIQVPVAPPVPYIPTTRALANRGAAAPVQHGAPIYRKMMGGPQTVPGLVNVSATEPGAAFAGYAPVGYNEGPTRVSEGAPITALTAQQDANFSNYATNNPMAGAGVKPPQSAQDQANGEWNDTPSWYKDEVLRRKKEADTAALAADEDRKYGSRGATAPRKG